MRRAAGFSMVELIMVMVIIGVLAAVAIPRISTGEFRKLEFHDKVVGALRYAQKTAVSHRRLVCVAFTTSSVTLTIARANPSAVCDDPLMLPGENSNMVQSGDTANAVFSSLPADFTFQPDGRGTDTSLTIADLPTITVVGATGHVQ